MREKIIEMMRTCLLCLHYDVCPFCNNYALLSYTGNEIVLSIKQATD
jgi:hypothetical protein